MRTSSWRCWIGLVSAGGVLAASLAHAQAGGEALPSDDGPSVPRRVEVQQVADDASIEARLTRILEATDWFHDPSVRVDEGVAFLRGRTDDEQHRQWAGRLASSTQDVVAVVNHIEVTRRSPWDLSPALASLRELGASALRLVPIVAVGLLLLVLTWLATRLAVRGASSLLGRRLQSQLLCDVAARVAAVPVFILGLYVVLKIVGLTGLAMTVIGGTGLLGLVIGFAFRDIAENFLASILLSMQRPFATQDRIRVAGYDGFVQSVNTRSTLLMTLEGNHVQIPNATIYKETITNFTANPNERFDFTVGIGYEDSIARAQSVALGVLRDHPAVLAEPEPLVLVEALGAATVIVRVYFWVDISQHGGLKVRSAVIRLVKRAFVEAGISMPDEAREVVFPAGVPVRMVSEDVASTKEGRPPPAETDADQQEAVRAEGDLASGAAEIEQQARQARAPEGGRNLLEER